MAHVQIVNPEGLHRPRGYSHGTKIPAGSSFLFIAGQVAWDVQGRLVGGESFTTQFDRALENLLEVVRASGGKPEGVVSLTLFVTNKDEYAAQVRAVGECYRARMGKHFPAMSVVQVVALVEDGAKVEIEATAVVPR